MKKWNRLLGPAGLTFFLVMLSSPAHGALNLSALPERTAATLELNGPAAVLTEERMLSLKAGINKISFSWQELPVMADTIRLDIPDEMVAVEILSVSRPPGEPTLSWTVHCSAPARIKARISYVLNQIDGIFELRLLSAEDEATCTLQQYVILRNFSGEDFENLSVITPCGTVKSRPVRHGETIRTLVRTADHVKIEKIWRFDSRKNSTFKVPGKSEKSMPIFYRIANTLENGLGERPIPGGKVRIFHRNQAGKTLLLGEDEIETIHPGKQRDLYIGKSRDLTVETNVMEENRLNIRRNKDNSVVLYDTQEKIRFVVENFKNSAAIVNLLHYVPGEWQLIDSSTPWTRSEAHLAELEIRLEPGNIKEFTLEYHRRNIRP